MSTAGDHRLPRTVVPARYELTLEPDLASAAFAGECSTEVEVVERTDEIVLNAADLEIDEAWLEGPGGARIAADIRLDPDAERLHLALARPVEPGGWFVCSRFRGVLNDQLQGFYRSTFTDESGTEQTIATTQMEATHARRAFPCWDEPDFKAVFAVTLVVDEDLLAVANTRELSRVDRGTGRIAVHFADSMVMSTYLVAFVVGPLVASDPVTVDGVDIRIIHRPGQQHLTAYSLEVAAFSLDYLAGYYDIAYPGDKLDLVAIPDFAFGAMENMGCVTFREVLLLIDPEEATQPELQRVVDVVAHELAHMWFGNLVTMKWWNGIWLNEAFATFMELKAADAFRPEWERWVSFGASRTAAFDVDALGTTRPIEYEVRSPEEAEAMFDVLTYEKGAAVVRMLELHLGTEQFRQGVATYLTTHEYDNTETDDLWHALENTTGEPAHRIMESWIFQPGFPLVHVERDGGVLALRQERFGYSPERAVSDWLIPLAVRYGGSESVVSERLVLEADTRIELPDGTEWVHVNTSAQGFYRVRYSDDLLSALASRPLELLSPAERFSLVDDTWAAVLSGDTTASSFLDVFAGMAEETDLAVWQRITECLATVDRLIDEPSRPVLQSQIRELLQPALDRVGHEVSEADDDLTRQLRGTLLRALATLGADDDAVALGRSLWERDRSGEPVDPALVSAAITIAARTGGHDDFDRLHEQFHNAETPQDEIRFLYALAEFDDISLTERLLAMAVTDEVRTQNAPYLLRLALTNRTQGAAAWRFIAEHWQEINQRFPSNSIARMLEGVRSITDPELASEIESFFETHDVPQSKLVLAQHLERMSVQVALREREHGRLTKALTR